MLVLLLRPRYGAPTTITVEHMDENRFEVTTKKDDKPTQLIIADVNSLMMYINIIIRTSMFSRIEVFAKDVFPERTCIFHHNLPVLSQCVYIWSLTAANLSN